MRPVLIAMMILALAGCKSAREGLGAYKRAADKGIELRVGGQSPDAALAADAGEPPRGKKRADPITSLPGGLGGDTTHPAYSEPTPR